MDVINKMTAKKLTRGLFYVLGTVSAIAILYLVVDFSIRHWSSLWDIYLITGVLAAAYGLFRLAMWAFSGEKNE